MKIQKSIHIITFAFIFLSLTVISYTQTKPLIKRTTYKTETIEFGVGGTVAVVGAPTGSITVEGWRKNEIEVSAEIEVQAENEEDLAELARVTGFVFDETMGKIRISSVGTHDKKYLKKTTKNFPKHLRELPFRIDYKIKVPVYSDLEIDGGKGDFLLSDVEGAIRINVLESNAKLNLTGGTIRATIGSGTVDVIIPTQNWRGRFTEIQLASGTMNVQLPLNLSAEIDATVLRTGQIDNSYSILKPRDRTKFTEKSITAKAGNGGALMAFTVGDGILKLN